MNTVLLIGATSSNAKADYKAIDRVSDTLKAQRGIRAINQANYSMVGYVCMKV